MEKFEKTLRIRLVVCIIGVLVGVGLVLWLNLASTGQEDNFNSFLRGFRTGLSGGVAVLCVVLAVRAFRALRNQALRQKLYIEETDERTQYIRRQVGDLYRTISLPLLFVATIIAGSFNITVFFTLLAVLLAFALLMCMLKVVCLKKY